MAHGVDGALQHGVERLDLALHQIHLEFSTPLADLDELLRQPLENWPPFEVKVNPMSITRELTLSQTWAGGQTLIGGSAEITAAAPVEPGVAHTRTLAVLVYELLGGSVSPLLAAKAGSQGIARYSPLANLTEEGNEVLRSAVAPEGPYRSAGEFFRALAAVDELENRHHDKTEGLKRSEPLAASTSFGQRVMPVPSAIAPSKGAPWGALAAAAVLIMAAGAAYFAFRTPSGVVDVDPSATPAAQVDPAPAPAPEAHELEDPPVHATPPPNATPSRRELLKAATAAAEKIEEEGDSSKTIAAWMDVARSYPESEIGKLRLEIILDGMRPKASQYTGAEFTAFEAQVREAAQLEVVSAMMLLGDLWREKQPAESFKWFSTAAAKGIPAAATQVGLMLSNGMGVERDLSKAVEFFQSAAEKGDAAAKAALGECLLYGKGVEKDVERAIELLQQAASRSNLRAISRLGTCYHQGLGVKQDYTEALRLFKKAADLGSGEALGNLGVLYMNGDGVPKSAQKAVEYFQKGAQLSDGYCMYLYARCFESGTGVTANPVTAQLWYKKAAAAGIIRAIEWCKKNGVPYE
jgi:TPR repeat protein